MKAVVALAVFACVATMVAASGYGYDGPGLRPVYNGIAAPYNNAYRQVAVNRAAEYKGASSGTARYVDCSEPNHNISWRNLNDTLSPLN